MSSAGLIKIGHPDNDEGFTMLSLINYFFVMFPNSSG